MHPGSRSLVLAAALCAVLAGTTSANTPFVATLDGAQEVPPNASPGAGSGMFVLNAAQTQLSIHIEYQGLTSAETGAHIHNAQVGVNGPVVFPLPLGTPKILVWGIPAAMVAELFAGRLYVNVHSVNFPGGELRGQIVPGPTSAARGTWGRLKALYR